MVCGTILKYVTNINIAKGIEDVYIFLDREDMLQQRLQFVWIK